jgi:ATP:cob(I)alamin adenosyltransferase
MASRGGFIREQRPKDYGGQYRRRKYGIHKTIGWETGPKYHLRPETYGTIDKLNSFLGMARAVNKDKTIKEILFSIQNHLFAIGSDLTLSGKDRSALKGEITQKEVDWLVMLTRDFKNLAKLNSKFIIYGETLCPVF